MKLFSKLNDVLAKGGSVSIVITKQDENQMVVSLLPDGGTKGLSAVVIRADSAEMDEKFEDAIIAPVQTASSFMMDTSAFEKSVEEAKAAAKPAGQASQAAPAKKTPAKKASVKKSETEPTAGTETSAPEEPAAKQDEGVLDTGETKPTEEPETSATEASAAEQATEKPAETATDVSVEKQSAPEDDPVKPSKSLGEYWNEGRTLFSNGDFSGAYKAFQNARALASDNQYATIDKALAACTAKMNKELFDNE